MRTARRRSPPGSPGQIADLGDGDRSGRPGRNSDGLPPGARPERDDTAVGLVRQLGAQRRSVEARRRFSAPSPTATLNSWTLEIATPNNPNFTVLATGNTPVSDGTLAQLNPDDLANGFYQLQLTATDLSGRTATTTAQIEINTATKPGDLVVTDADLSVQLDGTTVLIERTYDPLNRDGSGDFGAGWTLVNRQTNLQTNVPTTGEEAYGVFNPFSDGTEVFLTLPSGQRVPFTFAPTSFEVAGQTFYQPAWQAESGVTYTLESTDAVLSKAGNSYYDLPTGQPYNPGNPFFSGPSYTLVAPDHTQYQLDANGNIIGEITPSGAQLYISDSGITAANGQTIQFLRNSQGLITSIVAPDGEVVNYQYDSSGNLVSMQNETDRRLAAVRVLAVRSASADRRRAQQRQQRAVHARHDDDGVHPARPGRRRRSSRARRSTTRWPPGATDLFSFRLDQAELNSTATGSVLLRVLVQGTDGSSFRPRRRSPACSRSRSIRGGPSSLPCSRSTSRGFTSFRSAGATASTTGKYSLNLTVAGDLNGDGNVDGNDSALLAAAMGSTAGSANYSLAADINGDGKVDQQDAVILASDYGFNATTAAVPTTPPAQTGLQPRRQLRHAAVRRAA